MRYELLCGRSEYPHADSRKCGAEVKASQLEAELTLSPLQPVCTHGGVRGEHNWGNVTGNGTAEVAQQL